MDPSAAVARSTRPSPARPVLLAALLLLGLGPPAAPQQVDPGRRLRVAFLVWDGMELIESMGPAHVFSFAPGMDSFTVGRTTEPIRSEFVTLVPEHDLESCPEPDVLVIPGGSIDTPMEDPAWRAFLLEQVPRAELVLSVCNSAILLADLGLLDDHEATCGKSNLDDLMLLGKDVKAYVNRRWVHSGNIVTCESYYGGLDGALYAVRVLRGPEAEAQVKTWSHGGDLSRWDALQQEPGRIPVSRRRAVVRRLMEGGPGALDDALAIFQAWEGPPCAPELARFPEPDQFQWMAWGAQKRGDHALSLAICRFKARAWPDAAKERAALGEALLKAGRPSEAARALLEALDLDRADRRARGVAAQLLQQPALEEDAAVTSLRKRLAEVEGDGG
jgi:putative intracellular protease/amidase